MAIATGVLPTKAHASSIVAIIVNDTVRSISFESPFVITNGQGSGTVFHEALEAVTADDSSLISTEIEEMLTAIKKNYPELVKIDDLELLEAILGGSFIE